MSRVNCDNAAFLHKPICGLRWSPLWTRTLPRFTALFPVTPYASSPHQTPLLPAVGWHHGGSDGIRSSGVVRVMGKLNTALPGLLIDRDTAKQGSRNCHG